MTRKHSAISSGNVLVVDDDALNRELVSDILTSAGYDVVTAQDGVDALNQLVVPLPDAIISDMNMPRMSGFEFLNIVHQKYPDIPLIAMSGDFEEGIVPSGVTADAYVSKGSISMVDQLRSKLKALLFAKPGEPGARRFGA